MADDVLTLGGIAFDDYSTPDSMMGGGQQAMVVHKLPGGSRVIDILGPDEDDVKWHGHFYGDNAYQNALALDAMRAAGHVIPLIWGGQFRRVIIKHFTYHVRRFVWVEYQIVCTVFQNPALGNVAAVVNTIDSLISGDLAFAASLL